jgi:hypothetical protein
MEMVQAARVTIRQGLNPAVWRLTSLPYQVRQPLVIAMAAVTGLLLQTGSSMLLIQL